jgi:hypothetical protein
VSAVAATRQNNTVAHDNTGPISNANVPMAAVKKKKPAAFVAIRYGDSFIRRCLTFQGDAAGWVRLS